MQEPNSGNNKLENIIVILRQGDVSYGLNGGRVEEILQTQRTTFVPKQPQYLNGVFNYKGNIVPVISLGKLCGCEAETNETICVVFKVDEKIYGLTVEDISEMEYDSGEELELDKMNVRNKNLDIRKVIKGKTPIFVLDMPLIIKRLEES